MRIAKLNKDEWEDARKTSRFSSVFLSNEWINITKESFPVKFMGYIAETPIGNFLIPTYVINDDLYQIGFIGYGGPLPVFGAKESWDYLGDVVRLVSEDLKRKCRKIIGYPSDILDYESIDLLCNRPLSGISVVGACGTRVSLLLDPTSRWPKKSSDIVGFATGLIGDRSRFKVSILETEIAQLASNVDHMFNKIIAGNARTCIRKAEKNNIIAREISSSDLLTAHDLLVSTQRRVGSAYCTDQVFFEKMYNSNACSFVGAYLDDKLIGVSVFISGENEVFYYLNGTDVEYNKFSPNYLILWYAIKNAITNHKVFFNFGVSHYDSLLSFKKKWGGRSVGVITIEGL